MKKKIHKFENNVTYWFSRGVNPLLPKRHRKKHANLRIKSTFGFNKYKGEIRTMKISGNGVEIETWEEIKRY